MYNLRDQIVWLSKEIAECTDEKVRKKLKRQMAILKGELPPTEPTSIGDLMKGKL
jgi:hypothetical protein